jgi:hypothetical protein
MPTILARKLEEGLLPYYSMGNELKCFSQLASNLVNNVLLDSYQYVSLCELNVVQVLEIHTFNW